jgi:hypothetical protein
LSRSVVIGDQGDLAFIIGGVEFMEWMELVHTSHGRRSGGGNGEGIERGGKVQIT